MNKGSNMDHNNKSDKNQHQEHHHHEEHSPNQHADHNKSKEHNKKHVDHSGHEQMFRKRFWWSLLLSIPVLIYSPLIQRFMNFTAPDFPGSIWIPFVFSLIIFGYGGIPFLKMAIPEIRNRKPGMMTLISLAISVAFVYSLFAQLTNLGEGFFWELVTLIDIMLLGHWLEMRSVKQASGALNELAKLIPDTADRILEDGSTETVSATDLRQDDLVLVRPGASIPADGVVTTGESKVNESMITGESKPVDKSPEAKVIAGTINGEGSLRVRVTAIGDETALAGIMRLVEQAQQSKSPTQLLADKAAGWLFYIALAVAAITAVAWAIAIGFNVDLLKRVVTVLVIACPHALGLAVPLVVAITTSMGANNGILIRDRLALEVARNIDIVVFDKTGTLTEGKFGVVNQYTINEWKEEDALALAAAIESDSEHLIARAIVDKALERNLSLPETKDFSAIKGRGVKAQYDGKAIYVGGPRLLEMLDLTLLGELETFSQTAGEKSQTVVYLTTDEKVITAFAVADVIRPQSKQAVEKLHEMGVQV
ncbi:MAG: heavy metal translocating P-type ATPase, partial [Anaerolineaceae bacterium]|nr:heavy metal translocating P-type ATPase [Anaerolineaceae bacterium]